MKHLSSRILSLLFLTLMFVTGAHAGDEGAIQSLYTSGGANINETITISISLAAFRNINNSNVSFQIISPGGVVVDSHTYAVPSMRGGDTVNYSWSSSNSSYPEMGNYTVQACWSRGGSGSCTIDARSTTFYSADSLGLLGLLGLALLGWLLYRDQKRRKVIYA